MEKRVIIVQKTGYGCSASLKNYPIEIAGRGDSPSAAVYDMIFHHKETFGIELEFQKNK